jgi:flagellar protein FliO/FliZ
MPAKIISSALPVVAQAAAVVQRPFAAPEVANAAVTSSAGGIGQVTVALLLVLLAVFVVAVVVKKLRNTVSGGTNGLEVIAQCALGARERAVIVKVGDTRLLLGVASGQVSLLHTLAADALPNPADSSALANRPSFAALLKRSLGR